MHKYEIELHNGIKKLLRVEPDGSVVYAERGGLMKNIPIGKLHQMSAKEIKEGGSFNVVADGEFVAILVVPASAEKKDQFQALAGQMNAALGIED